MTETEIKRKLEKIAHAAKKADKLAEQIAMDSFDVFRVLKFGKKDLTAAGERMMKRVDKVHAASGDARASLGDVVWQVEEALKSR